MDAEKIRTYYGSESGVDIGFVEEETKSILGLLANNKELKKGGAKERLQEYYQLYSRMAPGFVLGESIEKQGAGHDIALMTFKSNALTRDLFNFIAITNLDDKELFITGSCDWANAVSKIQVFMQIVNDIKFAE